MAQNTESTRVPYKTLQEEGGPPAGPPPSYAQAQPCPQPYPQSYPQPYPQPYPQGQGYPMGGFPPVQQQPQPTIVNNANSTVVVAGIVGPTRPHNYMVMSCLVFWFCNCLFGGIAFGLSLASSSAADDNNMEEARKYAKAAMWVNVAGIILSVIGVIIGVIVYFAVVIPAVATTHDAIDNLNDNYIRDNYK